MSQSKDLPAVPPDFGHFPELGVLAFERRPGVFDVVDVVDGVAVVADLPECEGLGFLCGGGREELSVCHFVRSFGLFSEVEQDWVEFT